MKKKSEGLEITFNGTFRPDGFAVTVNAQDVGSVGAAGYATGHKLWPTTKKALKLALRRLSDAHALALGDIIEVTDARENDKSVD